MEPENKTIVWNIAANDFVPSFVPSSSSLPTDIKKSTDPQGGKKKHPKAKKFQTEEKKSTIKPKDSITISVIGPDQIGKSVLCDNLSKNFSGPSSLSYRILQLSSKSRKFLFFDSIGPLTSEILSMSQSDYILLVLSASTNTESLIKEYSIIIKNYLTTRLLVVITQMEEINWNANAYNNLVSSTRQVLNKFGINDCIFIPVHNNIHLHSKVSKEIAPWFNGKSLAQALETLETPEKKQNSGVKMVLLPIQNSFPYNLIGKVLSGTLSLKSKLTILPISLKAEVLALADLENNTIDYGNTNDIIKLQINLPSEVNLTNGLVMCELQDKCVTSKEFRAEVNLFNLDASIVSIGFVCKLLLHSAVEDMEVVDIVSVVD